MKKLISLVLALMMLCACTIASAEQYVLGNLSFEMPAGWTVMSQAENGIGAMKGTELMFFVYMDLNSNPQFEEIAPVLKLLDSETLLTLMAAGLGETVESEPVTTLPSGLSALYCTLDMSNYAEEGALFGICPVFVTANDNIVMMAYVSALGSDVTDETKADFRTATASVTPVN